MKITSIDTTNVTAQEIDRVAPILTDCGKKLVFVVETSEVSEEGELVDHKVEWSGSRFVCNCGVANCEHILWTVAFCRENKMEDYFLDEIEVIDRVERSDEILFFLQDHQAKKYCVIQSLASLKMYCSCRPSLKLKKRESGQTARDCEHAQAARAFESQFHAELVDYHARVAAEDISELK